MSLLSNASDGRTEGAAVGVGVVDDRKKMVDAEKHNQNERWKGRVVIITAG